MKPSMNTPATAALVCHQSVRPNRRGGIKGTPKGSCRSCACGRSGCWMDRHAMAIQDIKSTQDPYGHHRHHRHGPSFPRMTPFRLLPPSLPHHCGDCQTGQSQFATNNQRRFHRLVARLRTLIPLFSCTPRPRLFSTTSSLATMFDFRSDTFTKPTAEMFKVMEQASRGDDVYEEDESVNKLEAYVAKLTGHEAGLFCASGTMTNQLAFRALLKQPPHSILCDSRAHVYRHEAGGLASHSQATVFPIVAKTNNGHHITVQDIEPEIVPDDGDVHCVPTRIIAIENTLNGTVMPLENVEKIRHLADQHQILLHLDGARIWNATVVEGCELKDYCQLFDTVSLCVSKGIGAPIGSVLVGNKDVIKRARHFRKMFGGGWRQAGGIAAAAHWCIENVWPTMVETHKLAAYMAKDLEAAGASIPIPVESNMVFLELAGTGVSLSELSKKLEQHEIKIGAGYAPPTQTQVRLVLHWQISQEAVDTFVKITSEMIQEAKTKA